MKKVKENKTENDSWKQAKFLRKSVTVKPDT